MEKKGLPTLNPVLQGIQLKLSVCGNIKIGERGEKKKSQSGREYFVPKKLDHFKITTLQRGEDGNFVVDAKIQSMLQGDNAKLTEIPILFVYDTLPENLRSGFAAYTASTRWCHGDGVNAIRMETADKEVGVPCPCERLEQGYKGANKCRIEGALTVVIRGVDKIGGVWVLRTTSWNIVRGLLSTLFVMEKLTGGRLSGVPFWMTLTPRTVYPTEGKAETIYVANIEYRGSDKQLRNDVLQQIVGRETFSRQMRQISEHPEQLIGETADFSVVDGAVVSRKTRHTAKQIKPPENEPAEPPADEPVEPEEEPTGEAEEPGEPPEDLDDGFVPEETEDDDTPGETPPEEDLFNVKGQSDMFE